MIKITSVEIDGFIVPSQKLKLEFVESNIICIYGDNGSGKTSFLEILSAVFARDEEILDKYNVKNIKIEFKSEKNDKNKLEQLINKIDKQINKYEKNISLVKEELISIKKNIDKNQSFIDMHIIELKKIKKYKEIEILNILENDEDLKKILLDIKKKEKEKEKIQADKKEDLITREQEKDSYNLLKIEIKDLRLEEEIIRKKKLYSIEEYLSVSKYSHDINNKNGEIRLLEEKSTKNVDKLIFKEKAFRDNINEIEKLEEQEQKYTINDTQQIIITKKKQKDENNYYWDKYDASILSLSSSIYLGVARGIPKKENYFPRRMLWSFFNINRDLKKLKLDSKDIDDLTDKLMDYLQGENTNKEHFNIEEKDKQKNIYFQSIEIATVEELLVNKYRKSIVEADKKIIQVLSNTSMKFFDIGVPTKIDIDIDIDIDILKNNLLKNRDLILEVLRGNENYQLHFKNSIVSIFDNLENNDNYLNNIDDLNKIILFNIIKVLEKENKLFRQLQTFLDAYNSFLNYEKSLVFSSNGISVAPNNHPIKRLSSGEKHLLTFLATILLMGEEQDFILIDEPEISLNVDWQRKILSTIASLAPNSQIIVATHSPLVGRAYRKSVVGIEPKVIEND
ncbi:MAG: AAA family ATPase [Sulfurovum sp.]